MSYVNLSVQEETREKVKAVISKLNKKSGRRNVSYDEALRVLLKESKGRI
tara:strand:- start:1015 stop:1164 length:150 start_codon:yes stop_codon:yes gene_type:complete